MALVADEDPGWGGIGTYTGILAEGLRDLGVRVHMILRGWEGDRREDLDGIVVHRLSVPDPGWRRGTVAVVSRLYVSRESLVFSVRAARLLARLGAEEGVAVAEAPEFHAPGLAAGLRSRVRPRHRPRVVARLHAPSYLTARLDRRPSEPDGQAQELLEWVAVRSAAAVTAPTAALAGSVARRWRLAPGRVRVIPNPVDADRFAPDESSSERDGTILVVGRIEPGKGQDLLVEALPAIRRIAPQARLRFVGADGTALDGSSRLEALRDRARALGLEPDALTVDGQVPREALPAIYREASVCAVPSRYDNFPYTCIEAMACGRPIVAADTGGLPEMIRSGRDGVLVAPGDPAPLAAAIGALLGDPHTRHRLGAAARETVMRRYARPVVAALMAELYRETGRESWR
ncbi:MAG: glycosyltransferase family 4 protein [Actinobacteria bacterium]|nr:glycosyltransferase family 4 protein [Actinomycetota bacterium]